MTVTVITDTEAREIARDDLRPGDMVDPGGYGDHITLVRPTERRDDVQFWRGVTSCGIRASVPIFTATVDVVGRGPVEGWGS